MASASAWWTSRRSGTLADRLGRREQQQLPGLARQRFQLAHEALLDAADQRHRAREAEPAGVGRPAREFQQRQRVAGRLGEDPATYRLVERAVDRGVQQGAGVARGDALERQLRQPLAVVAVVAHAEHHPDTLPHQPARDERQRLRGHAIEPLCVVDDADERLLLGDVGEQAQHRQPDHEAIRRRARVGPERGAQRVALRDREPAQAAEHRRAQRVQAGERELHLGLDARRARDPTP